MQDSVGKATMTVTSRDLDPALKTGSVNVLSLSILGALMEQASVNALDTVCFICGQTSVTQSMKLKQDRNLAVGSNVTAIAKVTDVDQSGIFFEIEAFDEVGLVGQAIHKRVFVNKDQFERKCYDVALSAKSL